MADWKDFYEDNRERVGQFLDAQDETRDRRDPRKTFTAPVILRCPLPLCEATFSEDTGLQKHILARHGPQRIYLRLNGRIVRDLAWIRNDIQELSLILLGHQSASVELVAEGSPKTLLAREREDCDLKTHVPNDFEGELKLRVIPTETSHRDFTIYCRSLPEFRSDELDAIIEDLRADYLSHRNIPDIEKSRKSASQVGELGEIENRYVSGFLEYMWAFYLDDQGSTSEAKTHFEDAFGLLLPFHTPLAHSAQCVLGLRMNCFGVLRRAPSSSLVSGVSHFFNGKLCDLDWQPPKSWKRGDPFATYADQFTVEYVDAVVSFFGSDQGELTELVRSLEHHPRSQDKNNADKLTLLKARVFRRRSQETESKRMYEYLRYNPLFAAEAKAYLNEKHPNAPIS